MSVYAGLLTVISPTIILPGFPDAIVVHPDGTKVYILSRLGFIEVMNTASNIITKVIPLAPGAGYCLGLAINPAGTYLYATDGTKGTVDIVSTATEGYVGSITGCSHEIVSIAVSPSGASAFVTNPGDQTFSALDLESNTLSTTATTGFSSAGVTVISDDEGYLTTVGELAGFTGTTLTDPSVSEWSIGEIYGNSYETSLPAWNGATEYGTGDRISFGGDADADYYQSQIDANVGNEPDTSMTAWELAPPLFTVLWEHGLWYSLQDSNIGHQPGFAGSDSWWQINKSPGAGMIVTPDGIVTASLLGVGLYSTSTLLQIAQVNIFDETHAVAVGSAGGTSGTLWAVGGSLTECYFDGNEPVWIESWPLVGGYAVAVSPDGSTVYVLGPTYSSNLCSVFDVATSSVIARVSC